MNATDLKYYALEYLRYHKRCYHICTEFGPYYADVAGIDSSFLYEIEVKVTKQDFKADFKKDKHRMYGSAKNTPNYFYFLVPPCLSEYCYDYLNEIGKGYGLLTMAEKITKTAPPIKVVKVPKRLVDAKPSGHIVRQMLLRMGSEMILTWMNYKNVSDLLAKRPEEFERIETILKREVDNE